MASRENNAQGDAIGQQFSLLPAALVDSEGLPRKGQKVKARDVLSKRYQGILSTTMPSTFSGTRSDTVAVIDAMFTLQSAPLAHHKVFADYVNFLVTRWVLPMYNIADHVHLIFDDPGRHGASPKDVERSRQDKAGQ